MNDKNERKLFKSHENISVSGTYTLVFAYIFFCVCHMKMDGFLYLHHHNNISLRQSYSERNPHKRHQIETTNKKKCRRDIKTMSNFTVGGI